MATYFQGAVQAGQNPSKYGSQFGNAVFGQTALIDFDADLTQEAIFSIPANSQIVDIVADVLTAYNSATSATLTVGSASAGTQYASAVDAKTAGRTRPTFSAAQLAAMDDVDANTNVYATVTSVGQPTAGSVRVTLLYVITE